MIYCIEDDDSIRELMVYTLNTAGFEARGFGDSAGFWHAVGQELPELVTMDIMLPGEDGISILKKMREAELTKDIPVIMATAKGTEYDKVMGLDMGADDYLTKPFGMMEMVSRVKAVLRRSTPNEYKMVMQVGDISVDRGRHLCTVKGEPVSLTLKEFDLLVKLMSSPGIVFTREQLLSMVWGLDYVGESRTVDVHVGTLRTKLGESGACIETVRGVGYRMEKPQ